MTRKPIVVGLDDSPEARLALDLAWKIAEPSGAELVAVHAVPDLWLASGLEEGPFVTPEVREVLVRDSRTHLERLLADVLPRSARRRPVSMSGRVLRRSRWAKRRTSAEPSWS